MLSGDPLLKLLDVFDAIPAADEGRSRRVNDHEIIAPHGSHQVIWIGGDHHRVSAIEQFRMAGLPDISLRVTREN
jgi:hypothetical protein